MKQRSRKLAGTLLLIVTLFVYPAIGTAIYNAFLVGLPAPVLLGFFMIAGLGWAIPAGLIIKWMSPPDKPEISSNS